MATKAACFELAEKLGAVIEDDGNRVSIEAPKFHTTIDQDHELVYDCGFTRSGIWRSVWKDLNREFIPCAQHATSDCEWCDGAGA